MEQQLASIAAMLFECAKRGWRVSIEREPDPYRHFMFTFRGNALHYRWSVKEEVVVNEDFGYLAHELAYVIRRFEEMENAKIQNKAG